MIRNNKIKSIYNLFFVVVVLVTFFENINTLIAETPHQKMNVDSRIIDQLQNQSEVRVIITLKANLISNYSPSTRNSDEYNLWVEDIKKQVNEIQSKVIPSLSEDEFKIRHIFELSPSFSGSITKRGLDKLINDSNIERIELVERTYSSLDKSTPLINATQVWTKGYSGKGITVCVIDSGINYTHPALGGCFGSGCKVKGGYDYVNGDNNPMDDYGHGTNVAGIVASQDTTYRGVAPNASLVAIKVLDSNGNGNTDDLKKGIEWCRLNKTIYSISIITISVNYGSIYSGTCSDSVTDEINSANNTGVFVDVSSGNEGYISGIKSPSCASGATSVGAVYDENLGREPDSGSWSSANCFDPSTNADMITCFTNRASNLDLLAPGCRINSTYISGGFDWMCGTSQAAPHVAGAAALLLERDPTLTPDKIKKILKDTGKSIYDGGISRNNGGGSNLTFKRIDILSAINSLCTCTSWTAGSCGGIGQTCSTGERLYTRTCNPSSCDIESKCEYDTSCGGGGRDITVCASGCNYTVIQIAINNSGTSDRIFITDSRTYNEYLKINSTSSPWIDCQGGAKIHSESGGGNGIYAIGVDGPVIVNCYIDHFSKGIYLVNSSYGLIENNTLESNGVAIQLDDACHDNKIDNNNVSDVRIGGSC